MNDAAGINLLAVFAAAVAGMALGAVWYSPALFGPAWMREVGLTDAARAQGSPAKALAIAFALTLLAAYVFAAFLGPDPEPAYAVMTGLFAGVAWIGTALAISYTFEQRSLRLLVINAGYHTAVFLAFGLVFGLWP